MISVPTEKGKTMTEFITRNYGSKEFEVIIKTDNNEHYKASQDFARMLIDHGKNMTNADRIRAMSDDELLELLKEFSAFACIFPDKDCEEASCVECVTKWLRTPVEERQ